MNLHLATSLAAVIGAFVILAWRVQETRRPLTTKRIVIPPLGMSTGFGMFLYPPTRIPLPWAACAFALGALVFSVPLIKTSTMTLHEGEVYLKRSKAFLWVLLGLVVIRLALREYVDHLLPPLKTGSVFFILAFGIIVTWRSWMLLRYKAMAQP